MFGPFASDLSEDAVEMTNLNAQKLGISLTTKVGDKLGCWAGSKFDYIVDDISGIAEEVASASDWFNNVPNNSGQDGTRHTISVTNSAPQHLNPKGKLIFPVISLSNESKILAAAENAFTNVNLVKKTEWFLPPNIEHKVDLEALLMRGDIHYDQKFGKKIVTTKIFETHF